MIEIKRPVNIHKAYHAHLYYDEATLGVATQLCEEAKSKFNVPVGRLHQQKVGPHPMWSCQISFTQHQFDSLIPWLDSHRQGLTIFVHGVSGDDVKDHTDYAYWLGDSVKLNLSIFGL